MHAKHARRRDFTNLRRAVSAAAVAVGLVVGLTSVSTAAPINPVTDKGRQATTYIPNTKGAVTNWHLGNGVVYGANMGPGMVDWFTTVYDGSVHESGLDAALKAKVNAPDKDVNGTGGIIFGKYNVPIVNIGGPFDTNATKVGEFLIEPGTSLINTSAFFARTVAGVEGTRPQLALRYGDGQNAGTIMGTEISETANRELSGSTTKVVTVEAETTVTVWAFGYNDNASAAGGGEITVSAEVSAVKLG
jgi:hypothetical protein